MGQLAQQLEPLTEIDHPFGNRSASVDNVDEMWDLLALVKEQQQRLKEIEYSLRGCIGFLTEGTKKTRRDVGDKHTVKLSYPGDYWSQQVLKELARDEAEMSKLYLRIATYAPQLREIKKLESTTGNERFETYKAKILSARQPSTSPPTVSLEEPKS